MFSITLKSSAATLGVLAGLLAAAGPAGASQPEPRIADAHSNLKAVVVLIGANDYGFRAAAEGTQVGSEGVTRGGLTRQELAVLDTGMLEHEWVKAPTNAGTQIGIED